MSRVAQFDPDFAASIRPADPDEMRQLTHLLGRETALDHAVLLRLLGRGDGGLFYHCGLETDLASVLHGCAENVGRNQVHSASVAIDAFTGEFLYLDLENESDHPVLFRTIEIGGSGRDAALKREEAYSSIPALAFEAAFYCEMSSCGRKLRRTGLGGRASDVLGLLDRAGFVAEWFSCESAYFLRKYDGLVAFDLKGSYVGGVVGGARSIEGLARLKHELDSALGALVYDEVPTETLAQVRALSRVSESTIG
jgi:hypothetical protein